jgi:MFS family permease
VVALTPEAGGAAPSRADERRALGVAGAAHVVHDGYTDLLYLLLPIWQAEFGLGYAQVGMLKSCYVAVMAALQMPASLLAERIGPIVVLAGGTVLAAACFLLVGVSAGIYGLAAALILGGIGASAQHPIASNIVAGVFHGARTRTALGVYNFTGDLGKVAMPMLAAGLFALMAWRPALWVVAGLGFPVAALVVALAPAQARAVPARRERQPVAEEDAALAPRRPCARAASTSSWPSARSTTPRAAASSPSCRSCSRPRAPPSRPWPSPCRWCSLAAPRESSCAAIWAPDSACCGQCCSPRA